MANIHSIFTILLAVCLVLWMLYHIVYFNICTYDLKINYRQASLVCCSSWGLKEVDTTERLNKTNNYYTIQGEGACGCGCFPFTSGQEKKLGKPLKELNMCFMLFGRYGRLDSELYLKYLKHESLEEVAKGCLGEVAAISESVTAKELWFFFSPKDRIWVDNVEESLPGVVMVPAQEEASMKGDQTWSPGYLRVWKKSQMTRWNRGGFEIPSSGGRGIGFAK